MPVYTGSDTVDDYFVGSFGADTMTGLGGNDFLVGYYGDDSIDGGVGDDQLFGQAGADTILGGTGNDVLIGFLGGSGQDAFGEDLADELRGGGGDDILRGNSGNDRLYGDAGVDNLRGDAGNDTLDGGTGEDLASYRFDELSLSAGVAFNASTIGTASTISLADGRGGVDTLISIERVILTGTVFGDTFTGAGGDDQIDDGGFLGGAGNDVIVAGAGNDLIIVNEGNDSINAGAGDDEVALYGRFTDAIDFGNSTIDGGSGTDTLYYQFDYATAGVTFNASNAASVTLSGGGSSGVHRLLGVESLVITGSEFDDRLTAGTGVDELYGYTGNDSLNGGAGADLLDGGAGVDTLAGGAGNDTYVVINVADVVQETSTVAGEIDTVSSTVTWTLGANLENLTLTGSNAVNGTGNTGANTVVGNSGINTLTGGAGADTLSGGAAADVFVINSRSTSDLITDFVRNSDDLRVNQTAISIGDADTVIDGARTLVGPGGFAASAELVVVTSNISGSLTVGRAAAAIGSATSAYAVGDTRLFVVDNGVDTALYLFTADNANALVSAGELQLLATLQGTPAIGTADIIFGP